MKKCPYCGTEYPDDAGVCATDGYTLIDEAGAVQRAPTGEKNSTLGVVSFGMSIAVGCLMLAALVVAGVLNAGRVHQGMPHYPGQAAVGFTMIFLLFADLVAVGLGIAAVCQPGTKRLLGILGLVFASATVLATAGLILLGLYVMTAVRG